MNGQNEPEIKLSEQDQDKLRAAAIRDEQKLKAANSKLKQVEVDGYKFQVDTDLLDDVEAFEIIDRIESKGQIAAIVPLLIMLLGDAEYAKLKDAFTKMDAKEHAKENPKDKDYKARFRLGKMSEVYAAIIEKFSPKD